MTLITRKSGEPGADDVGDAYWSYDIGNGFTDEEVV
jgi:hypothetical protein